MTRSPTLTFETARKTLECVSCGAILYVGDGKDAGDLEWRKGG
jgi:hypothetical protein